MAVASPFVWGAGGEPLTVEEAKARREEAARIIAQATAGKPIQHMTQGFASVAQAMMAALDSKEATAGEKAGRTLASNDMQGLLGSFGLGGASAPATGGATGAGAPVPAAGGVAAPPSFVAATGGAPTAAFRPVSGDLAARKNMIVQGLVERGLSPNAAAAYAGNFAIENNADPIGGVGDNGTAFGLAQWRNERFSALKQLAASQGKDWRDLNVQLDHVVGEHKGMPASYQQTLASADPSAGANLVMRQYERPSNKAMADTGAKRAAMALAAFQGFKPATSVAPASSAVAPIAPDVAPAAALEAPAVVNPNGNPAAVADATRAQTQPGPRMVLSPQNPAVQAQPVRLASAGANDGPMPGGSQVASGSPAGQFLVERQMSKDAAAAEQPAAPAQQRIAQALTSPPPAAPPAQGNSRAAIAAAMKVMESPYSSAGQKSVANAILQKSLTAETPNWERKVEGNRVLFYNPKTMETRDGGAAQQSEKDTEEVRSLRLQNAERLRKAGQTEMETQSGPDGKLYQRPKGTNEPFTVAPEIGPKPTEEASGLRKEIQQLPSYKNIAQAVPIYRSMVDTAGRNTKASDLNLVYGLGKIFDPTSVVREGEMVMVKNTASLPEWFQGVANQLNGGSALTPETRRQIMQEAYGRMQGYQQQFGLDTEMYGGVADRTKLNRADIIPNFGEIKLWEPPPPPGQAQALPAPVLRPQAPATPQAPSADGWQDMGGGVRIRRKQ